MGGAAARSVRSAARPPRKVEALQGNKRELGPGRQVPARRVCQAQRQRSTRRKKPESPAEPSAVKTPIAASGDNKSVGVGSTITHEPLHGSGQATRNARHQASPPSPITGLGSV